MKSFVKEKDSQVFHLSKPLTEFVQFGPPASLQSLTVRPHLRVISELMKTLFLFIFFVESRNCRQRVDEKLSRQLND